MRSPLLPSKNSSPPPFLSSFVLHSSLRRSACPSIHAAMVASTEPATPSGADQLLAVAPRFPRLPSTPDYTTYRPGPEVSVMRDPVRGEIRCAPHLRTQLPAAS